MVFQDTQAGQDKTRRNTVAFSKVATSSSERDTNRSSQIEILSKTGEACRNHLGYRLQIGDVDISEEDLASPDIQYEDSETPTRTNSGWWKESSATTAATLQEHKERLAAKSSVVNELQAWAQQVLETHSAFTKDADNQDAHQIDLGDERPQQTQKLGVGESLRRHWNETVQNELEKRVEDLKEAWNQDMKQELEVVKEIRDANKALVEDLERAESEVQTLNKQLQQKSRLLENQMQTINNQNKQAQIIQETIKHDKTMFGGTSQQDESELLMGVYRELDQRQQEILNLQEQLGAQEQELHDARIQVQEMQETVVKQQQQRVTVTNISGSDQKDDQSEALQQLQAQLEQQKQAHKQLLDEEKIRFKNQIEAVQQSWEAERQELSENLSVVKLQLEAAKASRLGVDPNASKIMQSKLGKGPKKSTQKQTPDKKGKKGATASASSTAEGGKQSKQGKSTKSKRSEIEQTQQPQKNKATKNTASVKATRDGQKNSIQKQSNSQELAENAPTAEQQMSQQPSAQEYLDDQKQQQLEPISSEQFQYTSLQRGSLSGALTTSTARVSVCSGEGSAADATRVLDAVSDIDISAHENITDSQIYYNDKCSSTANSSPLQQRTARATQSSASQQQDEVATSHHDAQEYDQTNTQIFDQNIQQDTIGHDGLYMQMQEQEQGRETPARSRDATSQEASVALDFDHKTLTLDETRASVRFQDADLSAACSDADAGHYAQGSLRGSRELNLDGSSRLTASKSQMQQIVPDILQQSSQQQAQAFMPPQPSQDDIMYRHMNQVLARININPNIPQPPTSNYNRLPGRRLTGHGPDASDPAIKFAADPDASGATSCTMSHHGSYFNDDQGSSLFVIKPLQPSQRRRSYTTLASRRVRTRPRSAPSAKKVTENYPQNQPVSPYAMPVMSASVRRQMMQARSAEVQRAAKLSRRYGGPRPQSASPQKGFPIHGVKDVMQQDHDFRVQDLDTAALTAQMQGYTSPFFTPQMRGMALENLMTTSLNQNLEFQSKQMNQSKNKEIKKLRETVRMLTQMYSISIRELTEIKSLHQGLTTEITHARESWARERKQRKKFEHAIQQQQMYDNSVQSIAGLEQQRISESTGSQQSVEQFQEE